MTQTPTTEPITDAEIAAIRSGLAGVSPGPWSAEHDSGEGGEWYEIEGPALSQSWNRGKDALIRANAEHIARLDPQTVARLLARLEAAEAALYDAELDYKDRLRRLRGSD